MTIGHEFVGEIVEIKGATDNFKVGDIVSAERHVVCGKCRNCRAGRKHLCSNTQGIGVNRDGIFAEYARIRTQMSAGHSKENIDKCVQAFVECKKELGF